MVMMFANRIELFGVFLFSNFFHRFPFLFLRRYPFDASNTHVKNIGRMIEDLENKLRNHINLIYFGKTKVPKKKNF
jgi:hypothetical protein